MLVGAEGHCLKLIGGANVPGKLEIARALDLIHNWENESNCRGMPP
jgi:hypothetical protein